MHERRNNIYFVALRRLGFYCPEIIGDRVFAIVD